jgi:predicted esterase YcpF (UPF0227 family)
MNNVEKQVEYIIKTYGHAPEEAAKKICALFSFSFCEHPNIDVEGGIFGGYFCTDCGEQFEDLSEIKR